MAASDLLFMIQISDGYTFRNAINIMKNEIDQVTMILSPTTVEISFKNRGKYATHSMVLYVKELAAYIYNARDEDGNLLEYYPVAFEINMMVTAIKGIGRKDGLRIYQLPDNTIINVQPMKAAVKDQGRACALFINTIVKDHVRCDIPTGYPDEPGFRINNKDFSELCTQATTTKCSLMKLIAKGHLLIVQGILNNGSSSFVNRFTSQTGISFQEGGSNISSLDELISGLDIKAAKKGPKLNIIEPDELTTIKIPIATVKAMAKIHSIAFTGTMLKITLPERMPVKIESPIGSYGKYTVCIKNKPEAV